VCPWRLPLAGPVTKPLLVWFGLLIQTKKWYSFLLKHPDFKSANLIFLIVSFWLEHNLTLQSAPGQSL
jgi:hypothetical protein